MATLLLVVHILIAIALIITVLLQRSEGGGLGIGGSGGMMTGRGSGNILSRATAMLAAGFFLTSIALTILARNTSNSESKIDQIKVEGQKDPGTVLDTDKAPEAKKPEGPVVPKPE